MERARSEYKQRLENFISKLQRLKEDIEIYQKLKGVINSLNDLELQDQLHRISEDIEVYNDITKSLSRLQLQ